MRKGKHTFDDYDIIDSGGKFSYNIKSKGFLRLICCDSGGKFSYNIKSKGFLRLICCDCCLTHKYKFKIKGSELLIKVLRDDKLTKLLRKQEKVKIKKT